MFVHSDFEELSLFDPDAVKAMGDTFNKVWLSVADNFVDHSPTEIEVLRRNLALRIIALTKANQPALMVEAEARRSIVAFAPAKLETAH
jgi:hypothetical protein